MLIRETHREKNHQSYCCQEFHLENDAQEKPSGAGTFRCQVVGERAFVLLDCLACPSLLPLVCDDENQLQASLPGGRLPEQVQEQNASKVEQQSFEDIDLLS